MATAGSPKPKRARAETGAASAPGAPEADPNGNPYAIPEADPNGDPYAIPEGGFEVDVYAIHDPPPAPRSTTFDHDVGTDGYDRGTGVDVPNAPALRRPGENTAAADPFQGGAKTRTRDEG